MKISPKGRYALEALTYMASLEQDVLVNIRDIADHTGIPLKYLEQIFFNLRKSEILVTKRGPSGGYLLNPALPGMTAGDIVRAVETDMKPVVCLKGREYCESGIYDTCVTRLLWGRISEAVETVLDGITLQSLGAAYKEKQA